MPIARPKHWWIIVGLGLKIGFTWLRVFASTDFEDHLYMAWATTPPAQREIWRIVRGKRVFCGIKYIWDTPNICEQADEGDTLIHRFYISGVPAMSTIYWYLNAPGGPYGLEIQGPFHITPLVKLPAWSTRAYFASRSKGMFKTTDLSGPGGPHPTWIPDNAGLPFLDITQATPDPWDPYHSRFIVCHGDVYRMENAFIDDPAFATPVLAQWEAVALTGGFPGEILWVAGNPNYPGHFYVLFNSDIATNGTWCLKTIDYGESWTTHQIYAGPSNYDAGNIQAGINQRTSPYPPGDVLYAGLCHAYGGKVMPHRSFDEGETWQLCPTQPPGISVWKPRLHIHPADQAHVYLGANVNGTDLWRTLDHGATWSLCDLGNHLGIVTALFYATMGTRASDPLAIRVLAEPDNHIWKSNDFGAIWRDHGPTQYRVRHIYFRDASYDFLYLARRVSALVSNGIYARHVLFVSNDEGSNMFGKAGAHADHDDGNGDSIPWNCGGVAQEGILTLP